MKTKLTFLLSLTFLFLFGGISYAGDSQDGVDAYKKKDYKTAYKLFLPLANQGVPQDYKEAVKWCRLSADQGYSSAQSN